MLLLLKSCSPALVTSLQSTTCLLFHHHNMFTKLGHFGKVSHYFFWASSPFLSLSLSPKGIVFLLLFIHDEGI
ncbi:hypothetical protein B0I72DRAFT_135448 [Yarrowia lipolytica]|uniref:Uncharacterized protein n=1 Tax=Yarrowia lipolytica TaxID=4952 RepID=A0A371CC25_YARLL|nr:hypothetical protein BKA91DRAFT_138902 [Yarrowia lipolytica]KAE8172856.1 hypothetical protein BKA90DRAFT_136710 [Yarrowia lipolytica]RDW27854.1 hypothetical protein B0I71DRAFT_128394 [Yarrowia lipolytica]RDW34026.1 hypothetical protein B0I72DRAFT_135448 [Yarrowia lipolytica]RDW41282.1 hypothetical protein B0I73DRAFT_129093 [Yarrowia lipolytica]